MGLKEKSIVNHQIINDNNELLAEVFVEEDGKIFNIYIGKDDMSISDFKTIFGGLNSIYNRGEKYNAHI